MVHMRDLTNSDDLEDITEISKALLSDLFMKLESVEDQDDAEALAITVLVTCLSVVLKNTLSIEEKEEFAARFSEYIAD